MYIVDPSALIHVFSTVRNNALAGPVLVIGGNGFLGYYIVQRLFQVFRNGLEVAVMSRNREKNRATSATYYAGDITQQEQVRDGFRLICHCIVFHSASLQ